MLSQSRFDRQPFSVELFARHIHMSALAEQLGFDADYTFRVGIGRTVPSPEFRQAVSDYLGMPETELFTPEVLAAKYIVRANAKGRRREGGDR